MFSARISGVIFTKLNSRFVNPKQNKPQTKKNLFLQAVLTLTRELRFVENEFHYLKDNQERERMGLSLKFVGRRLLELVDELIDTVDTKEWRKDNLHLLKQNKEESVSATIKLNK